MSNHAAMCKNELAWWLSFIRQHASLCVCIKQHACLCVNVNVPESKLTHPCWWWKKQIIHPFHLVPEIQTKPLTKKIQRWQLLKCCATLLPKQNQICSSIQQTINSTKHYVYKSAFVSCIDVRCIKLKGTAAKKNCSIIHYLSAALWMRI